ncbi:MAG: ParB N-terminal domain-containing protein, partial [Candidatus Veblenbacteria bacterium]|nr:ParB N-terminal domain-containing protein [Candidatus Veblenbacteria bacterium]
MAKTFQLGRGLSSLIPSRKAEPEYPVAPVAAAQKLALSLIESNPHQPRRQFDDVALAELAASIKNHGLLQPLVVA